MSLENLAEKSPEERIEAIQTLEEAARKRIGEAFQASERVRKRIKDVHGKLAIIGVSIEEVGNFTRAELDLNSEERENLDQLKRLVDKAYLEKLKDLEIAKKKSEKSTHTVGKFQNLKV